MKKSILRIFAVCLLFLAFVIIAGCARHPSENEMKALEEQKQAVSAAEDKSNNCVNEKATLERQLAEEKQKVDVMKQEKVAVDKRLADWK